MANLWIDEQSGLAVSLSENTGGECYFCPDPGFTNTMPVSAVKKLADRSDAFKRPASGPDRDAWLARIEELPDDAMVTLCRSCLDGSGLHPVAE